MSTSKLKYADSPWRIEGEDYGSQDDGVSVGIEDKDGGAVVWHSQRDIEGFNDSVDYAGNVALVTKAPVLWELLEVMGDELSLSLEDGHWDAFKYKAFTNVINNIKQEMIDDQERLRKDS